MENAHLKEKGHEYHTTIGFWDAHGYTRHAFPSAARFTAHVTASAAAGSGAGNGARGAGTRGRGAGPATAGRGGRASPGSSMHSLTALINGMINGWWF